MIPSHEMRIGERRGEDWGRGEGVKARPEWALPAFSILVSAPSSLLAQVPTAIASKCDKNANKDLKKYLTCGNFLNPESERFAQSHKENFHFKTLITFEQKVPQRPDASQNDRKGKGYLKLVCIFFAKSFSVHL